MRKVCLILLALASLLLILLYGCKSEADNRVDDTPPAAPGNLEVEREAYDPGEDKYGDKVFLTWVPNSESDVKEYRVYRSLEGVGGEGGLQTPYQIIATTEIAEYTDEDLSVTEELPTTIYYYYITAVDEAGNESTPSDTVNIEYTPFG